MIVMIFKDGLLIGNFRLNRPAANVAFGEDGRLYITAKDLLVRIWIKTKPTRIIRNTRKS